MDERLQRLEAIHEEIGDIANTFAGDVTGTAAVELHSAAGRVANAVRMLKEGITFQDKWKMANEWCDKQLIPMEPDERRVIIEMLTR